jgi:hypothetical protein
MISTFFIWFMKLLSMDFQRISGDGVSGSNQGLRSRFLIAGIISLIFTVGVLQWSLHYGRLAYDITYDDVIYFQDAYSRVETLFRQGLASMIAGLFYEPPHSPYSTLLAGLGFVLFGPCDWVPYLMNGFTLFLFLGFLTYVLRDLPFILSTGVVTLFLFVPVSFFAVHEFRPDYAVAALTCLFALLAFEASASLQGYDGLRLRCAGVVFGLALLCKPSFFAHTLTIGFGVLVVVALRQLVATNRQYRQRILSVLKDFCLPAIALAVPYYAITWRRVLGYFWINTIGKNATIWEFQDGYWEIFKAFTVNGYASIMISTYLFLFSAVVVFSAVFLSYKRKWQNLYVLTGLMAVATVSLAIITFGRHNNAYLGLTYQVLLCFATCYCLSSLCRNRSWFALVLWIIVGFSGWHLISSSSATDHFRRNQTGVARKGNSTNLKIVNAIGSRLNLLDWNAIPRRVFVSFAGDVNASSMQWLALQQSMPLQFSDSNGLNVNDIDKYKKAILGSDFVVVSDEDFVGAYRWLPSYTMQKPVLKFLSEQPSFEEMVVLRTGDSTTNGCVRIFSNRSRLEKGFTFSLLHPESGFGFVPLEKLS